MNGDTGERKLPPPANAEGGRLVDNIMHFGRTLRKAGMPIGPGQVLQAIRAVQAVGVENRTDFYWTLHAVLVNRRDQRELFDQAFHVFWRNPHILERMRSLILPAMQMPEDEQEEQEKMSRRLAEALSNQGDNEPKEREEQIEFDASMTWSQQEQLREMDFEDMSGEEMAAARRMIERMHLPLLEARTRRFLADPAGPRADMRATIRGALRSGGDVIPLKRRRRRTRPPPLVVLCDISGSMERYSRMLLHFMHAVTNDRDRVHSFLFGTRLSNVTRYMRNRDVDIALSRIADRVVDWSGGTQIGQCIHSFNRDWSRRVLTQGAVVILITDGLDRDAGSGLAKEMDRLHRSCRRLIWLNPLLRYDAFQPKSLGIRAILPYVDDFRTVHNLQSLEQLAEVLSESGPRRMVARAWNLAGEEEEAA